MISVFYFTCNHGIMLVYPTFCSCDLDLNPMMTLIYTYEPDTLSKVRTDRQTHTQM